MIKYSNKKGFVLIYAVIVTSVVLVASLILADIITRQIIISSINKNYQQAYYMANVGRECAEYLDSSKKIFGYCDDSGDTLVCSNPDLGREPTIEDDMNNCYFKPADFTLSSNDFYHNYGDSIASNFYLRDRNTKSCALIYFSWTKKSGRKITSYGYNMECTLINPRKVMAISESSK